MKCISCEIEINPKWAHAINQNICPFCGSPIMEEHLKNLLSSLRETMDKLTEYQEQVDDWMLSNYSYIKTDSPQLMAHLPKNYREDISNEIKAAQESQIIENKKFIVKVKTGEGEEEVVAEKIQSDKEANDFFKRAEVKLTVDKPGDKNSGQRKFNSVSERTEYIKRMAQQIKKEGSSGITNEEGLAALISPEMMDQVDPEAVADFQSLISGSEVISSIDNESSSEEEIPSIVLAMANRSKNKEADPNADLAKLKNMQERVSGSRRNFDDAKGSFSRS